MQTIWRKAQAARDRRPNFDSCFIDCAVTGPTGCRFPNAPKDDWPANMILGNADLVLTLRRQFNA
jgi:hypothetical protein